MSNYYWEDVYLNKDSEQVSWYQTQDNRTIEHLKFHNIVADAQIIDVGSGASLLIDQLIEAGYVHLHVLDLSATALAQTQNRLEQKQLDRSHIQWIVGDIAQASLPKNYFDVWHDRAVFHFMQNDLQKQSYLHQLKASLKNDALLLMCTFAENGPEKCSGLPVQRYSIELLQNTLGVAFQLQQHEHAIHLTPWNSKQNFLHSVWRYSPE